MKRPGIGDKAALNRWKDRTAGRIILVFLFFTLMLVSGCATPTFPPLPPLPTGELEYPNRGLTREQLKMLETEIGDYRLGAGDVIQVYSVDVVEVSRKYIIGPDGKVTLPGIGVVSLDGLTREQASQKIEGMLKEIYLEPRISIIVEEYNNNRIFVLGEVRKPGQYNFPGRPLVMGALARAEGLTDRADLRGCTVLRGQGTIIEIDLYDLLRKGDRTLNIPLLPEDTVYVKASDENTFIVIGEVQRPGVFARGQMVDVVRAIAMAGGETKDGQLNQVRVVRRKKSGQPKMYEVDVSNILNGQAEYIPTIESGDIVYVPRKGLATFNYVITQITPSMNSILLGASLITVTNQNK